MAARGTGAGRASKKHARVRLKRKPCSWRWPNRATPGGANYASLCPYWHHEGTLANTDNIPNHAANAWGGLYKFADSTHSLVLYIRDPDRLLSPARTPAAIW